MTKSFAVLSVSVLSLCAPAFAQMPPMPQPGPEHEMLKRDVGVWDATVEMLAPGAPPGTSKGTETVSMLGAFWQIGEFKGDMMGQPFEGRGTNGYDPAKRKFVGTWIDTMTPGYSTVEGTYDPATKTMNAVMEGPDLAGTVTRTKAVTQWPDADTRVFTMYAPDGTPAMRITYKRRK